MHFIVGTTVVVLFGFLFYSTHRAKVLAEITKIEAETKSKLAEVEAYVKAHM